MQSANHSTIQAFPRRPIDLKTQRAPIWAVAVLVVLFGGMFAGVGWLVASEAMEIWSDYQIFANGVRTRCRVEFKSKSFRLGIVNHEFRIQYRGKDGAIRTANKSMTIFGGINTKVDPFVKYDPADDSRVALSYTAERIVNRCWTLAFFASAPVWMILGLAIAIRRGRREHRLLLRVLQRPAPITAEILKAWQGGQYEFQYEFLGPRTAKYRFAAIRKGRAWIWPEPLFLTHDRRLALALASEDGQAVLIDGTLQNLALDEAERAAILNAARNDRARGA